MQGVDTRNLLVAFLLSVGVLFVFQKLFPPPKPAQNSTTITGDTLVSQDAQTATPTPSLGEVSPSPSESLPPPWIQVQTSHALLTFSASGDLLRYTLTTYKERTGQPLLLNPPNAPLFTWNFPNLHIQSALPETVLASATPLRFYIVDTTNTTVGSLTVIPKDSFQIVVDIVTPVPGTLQIPRGLHPSEPSLEIEGKYQKLVVMTRHKVHTLSRKKLQKGYAKALDDVLWWALRSKFFAGGWILEKGSWERLQAQSLNDSTLGVKISFSFPPGSHRFIGYFGPIEPRVLKSVGYGIDRLFDYGNALIAPFTRLILWGFTTLHHVIPNYGWVIVVFALFMKLVFAPLTFRGVVAMKKMQELQPRLKALQKKYADDPQRLNQEVMKLYRQAGVNPLSGCLPLLFQLPVFYGLYRVLQGWIELRSAPFMLWIQDLSLRDPYYVLPILMGLVSAANAWISSKDNPQGRQIGVMMSLVFTFVFLNFPAGIVLYWMVYNIFSAVEQAVIRRLYTSKEG